MLPSILSDDRDKLMQQILPGRRPNKPSRYGIAVVDVRIRRADLPEETSQAIYDRMKSERERQAKELRAQGYEWGQQIKARADRERTVILAEAQRQAQTLRGEGDAQASRSMPRPSARTRNSSRSTARSRPTARPRSKAGTTLMLSPDSEFLKYFGNGPTGASRH